MSATQGEVEMNLDVNPNASRKPRDAWEALILRYAGKKTVCNCGQAYYANCGRGCTFDSGSGRYVERNDLPACLGGCSSNELQAREYVAEMVIKEFKINK